MEIMDLAVMGMIFSFIIPFVGFAIDKESFEEWKKGAKR